MSGNVFVNGKRVEKSGQQVLIESSIEVKSKPHPWVSRGGIKLEKAISEFNLSCQKIIALDIGASTGGFTDVLLSKGASKVYSVDVGYGQLDWKLRNDERVIVKEKTNARFLSQEIIKDQLDAVVCDASFISLKKVLPSGLSFLKKNGIIVVISFHSLEDNLVKSYFKSHKVEYPKDIPINSIENQEFKCIAKKIRASKDEVSINPRSRSAIMRVFKKL